MDIAKEKFRITPEFIFPAVISFGFSFVVIILCLGVKICDTPTPYNFYAYGLGAVGIITLLAVFFWPTKDSDDDGAVEYEDYDENEND